MGSWKGLVRGVGHSPRVPAPLRHAAQHVAPRRAWLEPPVAQAYWVEGEIDTILCINNFYSVLFPHEDTHANVHVELRGDHGEVIHVSTHTLEPHGVLALSARELAGRDVLGLALVWLDAPAVPAHKLAAMEAVTSHFYVYYRHAGNGSQAMIHPQTTVLDEGIVPATPSGQTVVLGELAAAELFQTNATHQEVAIRVTFEGDTQATKEIVLPPMTVRRVRFTGTETGRFTQDVSANRNGKPLLVRWMPDGRFSVSHA